MKLLFIFFTLFSLHLQAQIYNIRVGLTKSDSPPEALRENPVYTQDAKYPDLRKIAQSDATIKQTLLQVNDPDKSHVLLADVKKNLSVELNATGESYLRFKTPYKEFGIQFLDALTEVALEEEQMARYNFYSDSSFFYQDQADLLLSRIVGNPKIKSEVLDTLILCLKIYSEIRILSTLSQLNSQTGGMLGDISELYLCDIQVELVNNSKGVAVAPKVLTMKEEGKKLKAILTIGKRSDENSYMTSLENKYFSPWL